MQISKLATSVAVAATLTLSINASADTNADVDASAKTIVTDFSGRPPFTRRVVDSVEDSAQSAAVETRSDNDERVLVVEWRGAPPFKRRFVDADSVEVAQFARFEETSAERQPRRRGAPGKMFSRR